LEDEEGDFRGREKLNLGGTDSGLCSIVVLNLPVRLPGLHALISFITVSFTKGSGLFRCMFIRNVCTLSVDL
jgi:hypothetical protein